MRFFSKKIFSKTLVISTLALAFCSPVVSSVTYAAESSSTTSDVKDDHPDDADAVGGDQSTAVTTLSSAAKKWAKANNFDLTAFTDYKAPAAHKPTAADIKAFKAWMSGGSNPRNQVMKALTADAGDTIANEIWGYSNTIWKKWMNTANVGSVVSKASGLKNVGATQEGMFAGYLGSLLSDSTSQDGYENAAILIKDGFVVSSDGTTYRLHNISDGSVAYEIKAPETKEVSESDFPAGVTDFTKYLPLKSEKATTKAIALLKQYATEGDFKEPTDADKDVYEAVATYINQKFGEYYGQCPGPTVVKGIKATGKSIASLTEDQVGSSVGEKQFVASFFGVKSAAASLWKLGFLPSFDGTTYRLHSGSSGKVVYSITKKSLDAELKDSGSTSTTKKTNNSNVVLIGVAGVAIIVISGIFIAIKKKK
ncbi:hypothetical protein [Pseudolactococcus insecticola]|uniref:Gram-positive cocci surface proteins LPxTG domain-containing protein n=1 Tax=Pseudolactococcus insecticola TaxID=2709158 RepID=A0A6A0B5T7_9LACT|nr:hypothetical protein [Lactococcus insecticola]GFH40053.1 hypothetical protein Hs20B_04510 [Lactococcus insecticola]